LDVLMKYMYVHVSFGTPTTLVGLTATFRLLATVPSRIDLVPWSYIRDFSLTKVLAVTKAWHRVHQQVASATSLPSLPAFRRFTLVAAARAAAKP
jgi:hypothetical protein